MCVCASSKPSVYDKWPVLEIEIEVIVSDKQWAVAFVTGIHSPNQCYNLFHLCFGMFNLSSIVAHSFRSHVLFVFGSVSFSKLCVVAALSDRYDRCSTRDLCILYTSFLWLFCRDYHQFQIPKNRFPLSFWIFSDTLCVFVQCMQWIKWVSSNVINISSYKCDPKKKSTCGQAFAQTHVQSLNGKKSQRQFPSTRRLHDHQCCRQMHCWWCGHFPTSPSNHTVDVFSQPTILSYQSLSFWHVLNDIRVCRSSVLH